MNDWWNDPPEDYDPPQCCGDYMDYDEDTGVLSCQKCGKIIEPQPDIEPVFDDPWPLVDEFPPENDMCRHGNKPENCDACYYESDIAYDAWREKR